MIVVDDTKKIITIPKSFVRLFEKNYIGFLLPEGSM